MKTKLTESGKLFYVFTTQHEEIHSDFTTSRLLGVYLF